MHRAGREGEDFVSYGRERSDDERVRMLIGADPDYNYMVELVAEECNVRTRMGSAMRALLPVLSLGRHETGCYT